MPVFEAAEPDSGLVYKKKWDRWNKWIQVLYIFLILDSEGRYSRRRPDPKKN